jgi:hypothetical protein
LDVAVYSFSLYFCPLSFLHISAIYNSSLIHHLSIIAYAPLSLQPLLRLLVPFSASSLTLTRVESLYILRPGLLSIPYSPLSLSHSHTTLSPLPRRTASPSRPWYVPIFPTS